MGVGGPIIPFRRFDRFHRKSSDGTSGNGFGPIDGMSGHSEAVYLPLTAQMSPSNRIGVCGHGLEPAVWDVAAFMVRWWQREGSATATSIGSGDWARDSQVPILSSVTYL